MKYASEVIDLLGTHHDREFRMMDIVKYLIGEKRPRKEREAARKAVARVLAAMEESGSLIKTSSVHELGGYGTYRIKSSDPTAELQESARPVGLHRGNSIVDIRRIRKEAKDAGMKDPYQAYEKHKRHAAARGIGFELTFVQWWEFWKDHYHLRGGKGGDLCMGRFGDMGPYAVGNIYITTQKGNIQDYSVSEKKKRDLENLKNSRSQKLMDIIREVESLPPPQYTYEQVIAMLKLGIPFELRPKKKVGHEAGAMAGA